MTSSWGMRTVRMFRAQDDRLDLVVFPLPSGALRSLPCNAFFRLTEATAILCEVFYLDSLQENQGYSSFKLLSLS